MAGWCESAQSLYGQTDSPKAVTTKDGGALQGQQVRSTFIKSHIVNANKGSWHLHLSERKPLRASEHPESFNDLFSS